MSSLLKVDELQPSTAASITFPAVTITSGSISGITDLAVADGGTGASTAAAARSNLGSTTVGDAVFVAANAAAARTAIGTGTIATQDANNVAITGGSVTGITDLAIADGGTGASTAANAFTALKQAASDIDTGVIELAVQSEMETATDVARAVVPGRLHYHPAIPKAIIKLTSLGSSPPTATAIYNTLGALTPSRTGAGDHTLTWTTSLTNPVVIFSNESDSTTASRIVSISNGGLSGTSVRMLTYSDGGGATDVTTLYLVIYGDLP